MIRNQGRMMVMAGGNDAKEAINPPESEQPVVFDPELTGKRYRVE